MPILNETIDNVSPNLRDTILRLNIVTDTVKKNGLFAKMEGIGKATHLSLPAVQNKPSTDIEDSGLHYRDLSLMANQFKGEDDDTRKAELNYKPIDNWEFKGIYDANDSKLLETNQEYYEDNYLKNRYQDEDGRYLIALNYSPTNITGAEPYLDAVGSFTVGGPSTQILDVAGSILSGKGGAFSVDGPEPNYDVRGSLAGRALSSAGVINDSALGNIGAQQLVAHLGYNLQEDLFGSINTNVVSLLKGNNIVGLDYKITVGKGAVGSAVDFVGNVLGFGAPQSLLEGSTSIFYGENPTANILRADALIQQTGKGQVLALIDNLRNNKFRYKISDSRTKKGANKRESGQSSNLYAYGDGDGIIDLLKNDTVEYTENGLVVADTAEIRPAKSNDFDESKKFDGSDANGLNGLLDVTGTEDLVFTKTSSKDVGFSWGGGTKENKEKDKTDNNLGREALDTDEYDKLFEGNKNSLLYKTKKLFDSGKMRTLISGKGVQTGTLKKGDIGNTNGVNAKGFMSKGSAVLSDGGTNTGNTTPTDIFCRTWTNHDRYNQVTNLQKDRGLDRNGNNNKHLSVLDYNGFPKISPYKSDFDKKGKYQGSNPKKYMFSLENLAWADDLANLPECEKGPGDLLSGARGRIMWFPPYDIGFTDNSTVNWESNNFIGRGEPLYTYNNTERKGTLQWKIIVDHNTYQNTMIREGKTLDEMISFNAGCMMPDSELINNLSKSELTKIEVSETRKPIKMTLPEGPEMPEDLTFYYPNDSDGISDNYEDGVEDKEGTTIGDSAIVGGKVYPYPDSNDFSLNIKPWVYDDVSYSGVHDSQLFVGLNKFLMTDCKACIVTITGHVSAQVNAFNDATENKANQEKLAKARAESAAKFFREQVLNGDKNLDKRVITDFKVTEEQDISQGGQDIKENKEGRKSVITFTYDGEFAIELGEVKVPPQETEVTKTVKKTISSRFITECDYFKRLESEDKFTYDSIADSMQYFSPAFHSITPEGFNSRLTFLKQCTRQGPTKSLDNPDNLAFGRPPICILRVGDFYHTKIAIDNVSFSFDPLVWDLNPEGIGVQPMLCNVDMSFSFIGGSSLAGPINKLQNALSFNYFANTEIYDTRADRIGIAMSDPETFAGGIIPGYFEDGITEDVSEEITTTIETDQVGVAGQDTDEVELTDADLFSSDPNKPYFIIKTTGDGAVEGHYTNLHPEASGVTKEYQAQLQWQQPQSLEWLEVANGTIKDGQANFVGSDTPLEAKNVVNLVHPITDASTTNLGFLWWRVFIPDLGVVAAQSEFAWLDFECPDMSYEENIFIPIENGRIINENPCCACYEIAQKKNNGDDYTGNKTKRVKTINNVYHCTLKEGCEPTYVLPDTEIPDFDALNPDVEVALR